MNRTLTALLLATLLLAAGGGPLYAATTATPQATVTINAGTISISSTGSITLPALTLDGDDHDLTATAAPTFTLVDARGTGAGWNVTLQSGNFSDGGTATISASQFKITTPGGLGALTKVKGQDLDAANGPKELAVSSQALSSAQKVVTAASGYGKGRYTYSPAASGFVLTVYADTLAGSYTATVTATIATGP